MKLMKLAGILCAFSLGTVLCQAQALTYPYVFAPPTITCSPQTCNSYEFLGPGGYGTVSVFAQGSCVSGVRPYTTPAQTDVFCQYPQTMIYAYVYISSTPTIYPFSFGTIYAQTLRGDNGTYGFINGNWIPIFTGIQWNDCYTGALRTQEPPPHPC